MWIRAASTGSIRGTMLRTFYGEFRGTSNGSFRHRVIVLQLAAATDCFCSAGAVRFANLLR